MTAQRLRRVGNRGTLVDPAAVVGVDIVSRPPGVRVILASGHAMTVMLVELVEGRSHRHAGEVVPDPATSEDVDKVWQQLTEGREPARRPPPPPPPPTLPDPVVPSS